MLRAHPPIQGRLQGVGPGKRFCRIPVDINTLSHQNPTCQHHAGGPIPGEPMNDAACRPVGTAAPAHLPEPGLAPGPWDDPAVTGGVPWGTCWPRAGARSGECPEGDTWGPGSTRVVSGSWGTPPACPDQSQESQRDLAVEKGALCGAGLNDRLLPPPCKGRGN